MCSQDIGRQARTSDASSETVRTNRRKGQRTHVLHSARGQAGVVEFMSKKDYRRRPEHQALFNSREWQEIKRYTFLRTGGLCERCIEEGKEHGRKIGDEKLANEGWFRTGVDCHHIIPWETGRTMEEVKRLFFDRNNVRLLCIPCHIKTHQELKSHTKEKVAENKARARRRFMEANDPNWNPSDDDPSKPHI